VSNIRQALILQVKGHCMTGKANAFDVGDYVVYPKHGVGQVIELQNQEIAGMQLELYVLRFEKERMTLRVPTRHPDGQTEGKADHVVAPRSGI
jgi:transcription-repair coupling factor (superfamily II helicase)